MRLIVHGTLLIFAGMTPPVSDNPVGFFFENGLVSRFATNSKTIEFGFRMKTRTMKFECKYIRIGIICIAEFRPKLHLFPD